MREAIVLAGGAGMRLQGLRLGVPKPMADVAGRPFLEYVMTYLHAQNVQHACLALHYQAEIVMQHFGRSWKGMAVSYSVESEPQGTGGAVREAAQFLEGNDVLLLNGDTLFEISVEDALRQHEKVNADITLCACRQEEISRYGRVDCDSSGRVIGFFEKGVRRGAGWMNGGVYVIRRKVIEEYVPPGNCSFERDVIEKSCSVLREFCFKSDAYFIDIGIPEDYARAEKEFRARIPITTRL